MWKVLEGLGLRTVVMETQALPLLHWQKVPEGSWCPVEVKSHLGYVWASSPVLFLLLEALQLCLSCLPSLISSFHSFFFGGGACLMACRIIIPCVTRDLIWATGVKVQSPNVGLPGNSLIPSLQLFLYSTNIYQASAQGIWGNMCRRKSPNLWELKDQCGTQVSYNYSKVWFFCQHAYGSPQ